MIVEWLMDLWAAFCDWFLSLFGTDPVPAWLSDLGPFVADILDNASGLGAWFPFVVFGAVASTVCAVWLTLWLIKGLRWLYGLTPFSGGS